MPGDSLPISTKPLQERGLLADGTTGVTEHIEAWTKRWWRWLHYFGRVIFDTHTTYPLQTNMFIGCMIVVKCDTFKISGAYTILTV